MKKMILAVTAVAGLSLMAMGQAEKKQADPKKSHEVTSPRDAASGQSSGKRNGYDVKKMEGAIQDDSQTETAREASTGKATGKMQNVSADASAQVSTGGNQPKAEEHTVKSPRDSATGLASGKRQHAPAAPTSDEPKKEQPKK
jgi:hypothetical protein